MHALPADVVHSESTPTFDESSIPDGLVAQVHVEFHG